jgi:hypothetical protein
MAEMATRAAAEVLRLKLDFSTQDVERAEFWRDPVDLEHLKDDLRKAGLGWLPWRLGSGDIYGNLPCRTKADHNPWS